MTDRTDPVAATRFQFDFTGAAELGVEDIWPDGDAPENPTTQDVIERIRSRWNGQVTRFIHDWNFDRNVHLYVDSERVL